MAEVTLTAGEREAIHLLHWAPINSTPAGCPLCIDAVGTVEAIVAARVAAVKALAKEHPDCWVFRRPANEVTCLMLVGGTVGNGSEFTATGCCLPCRLRAALTAAPADPGAVVVQGDASEAVGEDG